MTTVQLELPGAGVRWQATLERPQLEVVRELLDPPRSQAQREAYDTPLIAREALDERVAKLLEAGFVHVSTRVLEGLEEEQSPVDRRWDAPKDDVFDIGDA